MEFPKESYHTPKNNMEFPKESYHTPKNNMEFPKESYHTPKKSKNNMEFSENKFTDVNIKKRNYMYYIKCNIINNNNEKEKNDEYFNITKLPNSYYENPKNFLTPERKKKKSIK